MKIGILTYHRSHNYGALLQAVATRFIIQSLGHEVYYIDYFPKYHKRMYSFFSWYEFKNLGLKGKLRYIVTRLKEYPYRKRRFSNFENFINNEIIPFCTNQNEKFDVIFYGSDQIWRIQGGINDFDPFYWGVGLQALKHVSLAASMGNIKLSSMQINKLRELVGHLDVISVREIHLKRLLKSIGFFDTHLILDPTLLLDADEWNKVLPIGRKPNRKYLLLYDLLKGSFDKEAIKLFAKSKGLEVIEIVGTAQHKDTVFVRTTDGPYQFLDLIRYSEFIFTSSFHGLVFSIIYNKPFYASFVKNSSRAESLLTFLCLKDYLLPPAINPIPIYKSIDYITINTLLRAERVNNINFIKENCSI